MLPDLGLDDARIVAALIVTYQLYLDEQLRESVAIRYQIPQGAINDTELDRTNSDFAWRGPVPTDEIQLHGWLKPEPEVLDVGFLIQAITQASSVCRVELPNVNRQGTGFLIAPRLLLTNYHILKHEEHEDIEEIASDVLLRFGCITAEEGKEADGQIFRLDTTRPILKSSPIDKLDYVLLQVEDRITTVSDITFAQYDLQPLSERMSMHILQHPEGKTMKLALNTNAIKDVYQSRGLAQYVTKATLGASGSPCFNEDWKVVALHHAERATSFGSIREGILFSSIYEEIKDFLLDKTY